MGHLESSEVDREKDSSLDIYNIQTHAISDILNYDNRNPIYICYSHHDSNRVLQNVPLKASFEQIRLNVFISEPSSEKYIVTVGSKFLMKA